jgi:hypothetical protein
VFRLAGLLAAIALATSRIGLIGHELVGHGGVALAAGARITEVKLYWFAGGWIRYQLASPSSATVLAIMMAGIAFELALAAAILTCVRGDTLGRRLIRGAATALVVHATWYLATGAFNGFGDGLVLYRKLGDARVPVAIAAGVATCTATFLGARALTARLARTLPATGCRRAVAFAIAVLLGAGIHAALTASEMKLDRNATYVKMMQPERDRRIAIELRAWERELAGRGVAPSPDAERTERVRLQRRHETFPFVPLLALATLASLIAGIVRSRGGSDARVSNRLLFRAVVVALASIFAVIVLDDLLGG